MKYPLQIQQYEKQVGDSLAIAIGETKGKAPFDRLRVIELAQAGQLPEAKELLDQVRRSNGFLPGYSNPFDLHVVAIAHRMQEQYGIASILYNLVEQAIEDLGDRLPALNKKNPKELREKLSKLSKWVIEDGSDRTGE